MKTISAAQLDAALSLRDLSDPDQGPHAIQHLISAIEKTLAGAWHIPVRREPGTRVVTVAENYDQLLYSSGAVTRDSRYSRYIDTTTMLRSHTTAAIPGLLRRSTSDILWLVPGVCYRRDAIDAQHTGEPHQADLWRLSWTTPLTADDLETMAGLVVTAVLPGRRWWTVPSAHPYTMEGREIYTEGHDGRPVEIGECGLVHPQILAAAGLPASVTGLAMGLGLDRLVMGAKNIADIRLLRSDDPRIASQMLDLRPYRPISQMPAICRDLSIAVNENTDVELLGDQVRQLLGDSSDSLEDVSIRSQTSYADLPEAAVARMGIRPGQHNLLVRLTIRHPARTLSAVEANALRDRVYARLHQGTSHEWSATAPAS